MYLELLKLVYQTVRFVLNKKLPASKLLLKKSARRIRLPKFKKTVAYLFADSPLYHKQYSLVTGLVHPTGNLTFRATKTVFPKSLFHIKCLFELEEFAMYDFFNFQTASASDQKTRPLHNTAHTPARLNFFYKIRTSIKIFRLHTLMFFGRSYKTEHRANLFLKTFSSMSTLAYIWFFEFNLAVFLVKVGFTESIKKSHMLVASDSCALNGGFSHSRWTLVSPGDLVQMTLSGAFTWWLLSSLGQKLNLTQKYAKLVTKLFFRKKLGGVRVPKQKKALTLTWSKQKPFHLFEVDPKTASVFLLPYKNNATYFRLVFTLWLNYWNFRVVLWKYRT